MLGPPAAGKGTQAELLHQRFGFQAPSVGAMLRHQKAAGTPAGLRAAEYFERGLLVPDEITIEVVRQWLAENHGPWVIDGYPRTIRQAEAFDAMCREQGLDVDLAIFIHVDEAIIRERVARRLVCLSCGGVFRLGLHISAESGPCPRCGGALGRRADDNPDALSDRLVEYQTKTEPVNAFYNTRGILRSIDGNREVEAVFADIAAAVTAPSPSAASS